MSPHGPGYDAVERLIAQLPPDLRDSRDVPIVASQVRRALAELAKCPPDTMINDEVSWWQRTVLALLSAGLDLSPWLAGDAPDVAAEVEREVRGMGNAQAAPESTVEPVPLPLEEPELTNVRETGLTDESIRLEGFRTVRGEEIDRVLGWPISRTPAFVQKGKLVRGLPCTGLLIPIIKPGETEPYMYRVRLRYPRPKRDDDGNLKIDNGNVEGRKYEGPVGQPTAVYYGARTRANGSLQDILQPLLIVEGEKKDALLDQLGYAAVGLTGIECAHDVEYRNAQEVARAPKSEWYRLRREITDHCAIAGRDIVIFFDKSDKPKPREPHAAQRIANMFYALGAKSVRYCTPPPVGKSKGLDDLYVHAACWHGDVALNTRRDCAETLEAGHGANAIRQCIDKAVLLTRDGTAPSASAVASGDRPTGMITLRGADEIFKPLPDMQWISSDLMLGSGRPTMLVAYSGTGKSLIAQALALAVAAGKPIWGKYEIAGPMSVVHLDYEQGTYATYRRYQRLALGHGISESEIGIRLHVASHPPIYLTDKRASDELERISEGRHVVIIDSLRAAAPGVDENDSKVREYLDLMSRLSEATGTAYVVIHHAGKGGDAQADARHVARGSSSIFDASGCVFAVKRGRKKGDPLEVTMAKSPASAEGQALADFGLMIEDVASEARPVRLVWSALDPMRHSAGGPNAAAKYDSDSKAILQIVARNPGITLNALVFRAGIQKARAIGVVKSLVDEGRIRTESGEGKAVRHFAIGKESSDDD